MAPESNRRTAVPDDEGALERGRRSGRVPSVAASVELARIELRRGYRWLWTQDVWMLFLIVVGLFGAFFVWTVFDVAREVGAALAAGEPSTPSPTGIRLALSVTWLFLAAFLAVDAVGSNGDLDNGGHYLTIRPTADLAGGALLAAACKFSPYALLPAAAGSLGLAVGAGTVRPAIGILAAGVAVVATATAVGYPIGLALKGAIRRSESLTRLKPVLAVAAFVAYFAVMFSGEFTTVVDAIEPALLAPPLEWLGDLALVTTPGADADAAGALVAAAASALTVGVGVFLSIPAARYAWTADRVRPEDDGEGSEVEAPDHRIDALLGAVCREPATLGIASTILVRIYRAPLQLVFVALPLLGALPLAEGLLATGTLPWYAPWFAVWYGAWAAGAAAPLNPLGAQGATLPTLLTAPADGRRIVHGHVVATLPIAPLTALLAAGIGLLAGRPGPELAVLALAGAVAVVAGAVLAAGIGSVFPRFESVDFSGSREAVPPSKVAYAVFSVVLVLTIAAVAVVVEDVALELAAVLLSERLPFGATVSTDAVTGIGWSILALVAVSIPLAYRVAVRRVDAYRLS